MSGKVRIGDGSYLKILGIGKIKLEAWDGHEWVKTTITGVLFVPELKINLFSIGCALDKGCKMHSDNTMCKLVNENGKVCGIANRQGKLYKMLFRVNQDIKYMSVSTPINQSNSTCQMAVETLTEWHKKLAHQNYNQIRKVLTRNNIKFKEESLQPCKDCLGGKQHRSSYPASQSRASRPCELIHSDLCGPMETTSLGGARYFLLFKLQTCIFYST